MAKRVKSDKLPIIPIADKQEADDLLRAMGLLNIANTKDEDSAKLRIDAIQASLAQTVNSRKVEIDQIQRSLEAYAANHPEVFKGQRSLKLAFGTIGYRKSTSITIAKDTLDLVKQVFSKVKAAAFIKVKETISKDALASLTDEQLASVGARRKIKDAFFAEPSYQQAADYQ